VTYPDIAAAMPEIHRSFGPDDLEPLLAAAGVDGTVLVQAANDLTETALLLGVASQLDWVLGVVGWIPLGDAADTAAALDQFSDPALVGVRHLIHREPDPRWLSSPATIEALRVLAARGLAYDVCALAKGHLDNAPAVAEQVPDLTIVIDHLGGPYVRGDRWEPWASLIADTATHDRCFVKFSSLDPIDGSVERYRPYVEHVFEHFGDDRVMWASNWPATRRGESYQQMVDDSFALLPVPAGAATDAVFGANARRAYGC
jgi:L-fuconolactonase